MGKNKIIKLDLRNSFYLHVWWWCFFSPKKAKKFYYWKLHGMNNYSAYLQVRSEKLGQHTSMPGKQKTKQENDYPEPIYKNKKP